MTHVTPHAGSRRHGRSSGFTLIEVLIAITLLGISYAAVLGAFSGSLRLLRQASEYQNAMLLARAKLEETRLDTRLDIVDHEGENEENYGGVVYAYKIEIRSLPLLDKELAERVKLPLTLETISVEVFWGKAGQEKRYQLNAWQTRPSAPAAPPGQPEKPMPEGGGAAPAAERRPVEKPA